MYIYQCHIFARTQILLAKSFLSTEAEESDEDYVGKY